MDSVPEAVNVGHGEGAVREVSLDGVAPSLWQGLLERDPAVTIYHSPAWLRVVQRTYGCPVRLLVQGDDRCLRGMLPLVEMRTFTGKMALVSLPFSNYGGPLGGNEERAALLRAAESLADRLRAQYVEFRMCDPLHWPGLATNSGYVSPVLDLAGGTDMVWRTRLNDKTRNQVRKAECNGVVTKGGLALLGDFMDLYWRRQRDLGSPGHGRAWFRAMAEELGDLLVPVVAYHESVPVAGVLLLVYGRTALVQYGASRAAAHRFCPNHAAYWRAIEYACERGLARLDFGRTRPESGSFHFKMQWGTRAQPTPYHYILSRSRKVPVLNPEEPRYRWAVALWKRLPLRVAGWLGPRIRPRVMA